MKNAILLRVWYLLLVLPFLILTSCADDDKNSRTPGSAGTLVANFQAEVDTVNFLLVRFNNLSENASFYEWDFGDSTTSTEKNPTHEYARGGTYRVTLTVKNANGTSSAAISNDVIVSELSGPAIASFQSEVDTVNPLLVNFINFSQNAISYEWEFGDSETSTEENPAHEYAASGTYTVTLTATGANGSSSSNSKDITVSDPIGSSNLLYGNGSKTWKLFREGVSMSLGESREIPDNFWPGLENDGSRDCQYEQTFTFHSDGTYEFNDMGSFWGEFGVWSQTDPNFEICFDAIPVNMVNLNGDDISAWLSGTHSYTYDPIGGVVTLNGLGSWMGISKLGATDERLVPTASTSFIIEEIREEPGYDVMTIGFDWGTAYWKFVYVNYSDPSLEPALGTGGGGGFGQDLPDQTPTDMFNTFASTDAADVQELVPTQSDVVMNIGVFDPAGGSTPVGEYIRGTALFSDLKFQLAYDCQFDNFSSVSVDVYFPSGNDYSGDLSQQVDIFIADASQTQEFWTNWVLFVDNTTTVTNQWVTFTFPLGNALTRNDLDLIGLKIGGEDHSIDGTFYVRNFVFQ